METKIDPFREGELRGQFGSEYEKLSADERNLLADDVGEIMADEERTFMDAAWTLRKRIGGLAALRSYVDCLVAGAARRNKQ